jgi:tRNA(Ile)-lysidine synthase TilS/MesJ
MTQAALKPPKSLLRQVGRAIGDFHMIRDGDRILLGVSGGKDSLSLLHILRHLRTYAPVRFDLAVLTVDPQVPGFDPEPLKDYYSALGVPWFYERQPIMEQAKGHMDGDSFCAYCSRMKRGIMYRICRAEGYGVLALAQHLDDLAESLLLSLFHGGPSCLVLIATPTDWRIESHRFARSSLHRGLGYTCLHECHHSTQTA